MPTVQWSEKYVLGVEQMDATHREFIEMLNAVFDAADEQVLAELDRFIEHTEAHFEQENQWMAETGFPPAHCHTAEHHNVLAVMREVRGMVVDGKAEIGRVLAREMAPWFDVTRREHGRGAGRVDERQVVRARRPAALRHHGLQSRLKAASGAILRAAQKQNGTRRCRSRNCVARITSGDDDVP